MNALDINTFEKFAECVHPDDRRQFIGTMDAVLKQDSGEWDIEYRADLRGNGNYEGGKSVECLRPLFLMILLISMSPA